MNRTIIIHADIAATGGTLLLEVAMRLREHRLRPEALDWSVTGPDRVKLEIVVAPGREHHLPALVERFKYLPDVTRIEIQSVH